MCRNEESISYSLLKKHAVQLGTALIIETVINEWVFLPCAFLSLLNMIIIFKHTFKLFYELRAVGNMCTALQVM